MSLSNDLSALAKELRIAAVAAVALGVTMVLPWYQKSYFAKGGGVVQDNLSAFGAFSFVEAAVLLVALAVLFLVWARSQKKAFHLPGGDGTAITIAGGWALLLLIWRLFDKPSIAGAGATIGLQWGIFAACVAAGAVLAAGLQVRAAHRPEPPNPAAGEDDWVAPPQRRRERPAGRRPRDATAVTDVLRDPPSWEGEVPEPAPARNGSEDVTERIPRDRERTDPLPDPPTRRRRDADA